MSSTVSKRPSTQLPIEVSVKADKVLEMLGISDNSLLSMLYTYIARSGKIPEEIARVTPEELEAIEYEAISQEIVASAKVSSRKRVRVTKDNIDEVMHAIDE